MKTITLKDGELRIYPVEEPYDRSAMYVLDVLGATVSLRLVPDDPADEDSRTLLQVVVEASGVFNVSINDDMHTYGEEG